MSEKAESPTKENRLLHDLRVHQIQLEMQNEELRRAQAELDAVRQRYFDLYNLAPVGYCTISEQGVIMEANLTAANLLGTTRNALTNKPITMFILSADQDIYYLRRKLLFETGEPQKYELRMTKYDGTNFWAHLDATYATADNGTSVCRIVMTDISDRKRMEAELLKMKKLQSIGTLAGGIAHDFNNILMGLFGNISLAKSELPKDHPSFKSLEFAEKSMSRAVLLTGQLLTFAKGGDPVLEDVRLGPLAEEVARFVLSGSQVSLTFQQAVGLWMAKVDKSQIQQVISNLTINAREAMPSGGHLYINLENADIQKGTHFKLHPGKYIKMTLRDEGIGIDPKTLDRIFDPYFTTKHTGCGLGLATTYSIISKHGGTIDVASELGKGTTFTIYLPASEVLPVLPENHPDSGSPVLKTSLKILVLDDEEFIRLVIPRWLNRMGCLVETSADGRQTIELYQQALKAGTPFDVLILDLTIPGGIGGQEALKAILAMDPHAKAIVSSGYAEGPVMSNFPFYGFKGVLVKPYTESQLHDVLKQVLS